MNSSTHSMKNIKFLTSHKKLFLNLKQVSCALCLQNITFHSYVNKGCNISRFINKQRIYCLINNHIPLPPLPPPKKKKKKHIILVSNAKNNEMEIYDFYIKGFLI